jgi:hypothetical protein
MYVDTCIYNIYQIRKTTSYHCSLDGSMHAHHHYLKGNVLLYLPKDVPNLIISK